MGPYITKILRFHLQQNFRGPILPPKQKFWVHFYSTTSTVALLALILLVQVVIWSLPTPVRLNWDMTILYHISFYMCWACERVQKTRIVWFLTIWFSCFGYKCDVNISPVNIENNVLDAKTNHYNPFNTFHLSRVCSSYIPFFSLQLNINIEVKYVYIYFGYF